MDTVQGASERPRGAAGDPEHEDALSSQLTRSWRQRKWHHRFGSRHRTQRQRQRRERQQRAQGLEWFARVLTKRRLGDQTQRDAREGAAPHQGEGGALKKEGQANTLTRSRSCRCRCDLRLCRSGRRDRRAGWQRWTVRPRATLASRTFCSARTTLSTSPDRLAARARVAPWHDAG